MDSIFCIIDFSIENTSGQVTFTGLGDYNGKYVYGTADGNEMLTVANGVNGKNQTITCAQISSGSVTLKVWKMEEDGDIVKLTDYKGNDKVLFYLFIYL